MVWPQNYDPTGSVVLSTLIAALPIVVLLGTLGLLSWPASRAAAVGLLTALIVAIGVYDMPWTTAFMAAAYGAGFGLFPIGWIVLGAVFLYSLTVETGEFEKVKLSVAGLSPDRRVQAILIAFCFGGLIEGAAGFGAPVAISAALMIGAGFRPLNAACLALIANTAPVAFGSLGTPIAMLHKVTGLPEMALSQMAGRQLPFFSLIIPAWMVVAVAGWRGLLGVWPAALVSGGSFALVQFVIANFFGPTLVDVGAGAASLIATTVLLKVWQPCVIWRFEHETEPPPAAAPARPFTRRQLASAWVPWVFLATAVLIWGIPPVRTLLDGGKPPAAMVVGVSVTGVASGGAAGMSFAPAVPAGCNPAAATAFRFAAAAPPPWWERPNVLAGWTDVRFAMPGLHKVVVRDDPAVAERGEAEEAIYRLNWLSATGTGLFLAAVLSAWWMGVGPRRFVRCYAATLHRMRWPLFTIAAMLAIAFTTRYSGTDVTLGLAFTHTGVLYPFFAAMLGWLGVALTGSDTSSNALFGSLQKITAEHLGLNPILTATANSTGGVMGKMIDAQSIVVSAAATHQPGGEGEILRHVFWHSLALAALMGGLTLLQAYVLKWMVPVL